MNSEMKNHITIAVKLTIICFIATLLLTVTNLLTKNTIDEYEKKMENEANRDMFPDGLRFEKGMFSETDVDTYYYRVFDSRNELIGYIVATTGSGYGGEMKLVIGFQKDLSIKNMKLLANSETPRIGKKAEEDSYMQKFIGTNTPSKPFPEKKDQLSPKERDAITGATITFNGITKAAKEAIYLLAKQVSFDYNNGEIKLHDGDLSSDMSTE